MHKLIEFACDELEQLEKKAAKGSLSAAEVEYADKLASLKKNLLKGEKLYSEMEEEGYSGNMGNSYARGDGRGRGRNAKRDSMGRYSGEDGYSRDMDAMLEQLYGLEQMAPDEQTRMEIKRLTQRMEQMPR